MVATAPKVILLAAVTAVPPTRAFRVTVFAALSMAVMTDPTAGALVGVTVMAWPSTRPVTSLSTSVFWLAAPVVTVIVVEAAA